MLTDTLTDNPTDTVTDTTDTDTDTTDTIKRIIPRSDDKIVRLDVRFPKSMHDDIEALAIANGAAIHHISKKPTLTPTILKLIRLGLDNYSPESLERIQARIESDKISKTLTDNCNDLEAIKAEILDQLRGEIFQPPAIDPNIEARLEAMEAAIMGK